MSSLTRELQTAVDSHSSDVGTAPSHSATFHWEWNGLYMFINTYISVKNTCISVTAIFLTQVG